MIGLNEEQQLWRRGYKIIVGLDESGRGPLAGPVVAAAIVINSKFKNQNSKIHIKIQNLLKGELKDSKKLSPRRREEFYEIITSCSCIEWGIGRVRNKVIDRINILEATKLAMKRAVKNLKSKVKCQKSKVFLLIDGNFGIDSTIPQKSIIKGDEKIFLIKLASIVAKVTRDRLMLRCHKKYPQYGFDKHKGYGTRYHIAMLQKHGPCDIHRISFSPVSLLTN